MILEIATITVKPGTEAEFEAGVAKALPHFSSAKGCKGLKLQRSVDRKGRYQLFVQWETLENHTVDFRGSKNFQDWRALVAHLFDGTPVLDHVEATGTGF